MNTENVGEVQSTISYIFIISSLRGIHIRPQSRRSRDGVQLYSSLHRRHDKTTYRGWKMLENIQKYLEKGLKGGVERGERNKNWFMKIFFTSFFFCNKMCNTFLLSSVSLTMLWNHVGALYNLVFYFVFVPPNLYDSKMFPWYRNTLTIANANYFVLCDRIHQRSSHSRWWTCLSYVWTEKPQLWSRLCYRILPHSSFLHLDYCRLSQSRHHPHPKSEGFWHFDFCYLYYRKYRRPSDSDCLLWYIHVTTESLHYWYCSWDYFAVSRRQWMLTNWRSSKKEALTNWVMVAEFSLNLNY